jgi:seryl-tRNA synthetase
MIDIELLRKDYDNVVKKIQSRNKDYPQLEKFKVVDNQ